MNFNNNVGIGAAHEVAERYGEAAQFYRRALQERPHAFWILRFLVSALVGAGRMDEAKVEFEHLRSVYPDSTITKFRNAMMFSPAMMDRMAAHWRAVGLPD
jgi:adenylate cyclase